MCGLCLRCCRGGPGEPEKRDKRGSNALQKEFVFVVIVKASTLSLLGCLPLMCHFLVLDLTLTHAPLTHPHTTPQAATTGPCHWHPRQAAKAERSPIPQFHLLPACVPSTHPPPTRNTTMDTSGSTRPSWVNNTPHHAHAPLQSQQLPPGGGGAPVVMESLKLRVEEEREYYSVVAALPGVRKQGTSRWMRLYKCLCARSGAGFLHGCSCLCWWLCSLPSSATHTGAVSPPPPARSTFPFRFLQTPRLLAEPGK